MNMNSLTPQLVAAKELPRGTRVCEPRQLRPQRGKWGPLAVPSSGFRPAGRVRIAGIRIANFALLAALVLAGVNGPAQARPGNPPITVANTTPAVVLPPVATPVTTVTGGTLLAESSAGGDPAAAPSSGPLPAPAGSGSEAALQAHTQGKIIEKFRADNLDLKTALALFASQNDLNIVPDNDVVGTVTLDVHNLPLDQMMRALLEAGDYSWQEENGLIRVRNTETRTFTVDYLRLKRQGLGNTIATLESATAGTGTGSSGGGGGGVGGGGSGGGSGSGSGNSASSSSVNITADNTTDFWTELRTDLMQMLTDEGKHSLAMNKTAGIIEVTDRPSVLKRVEHYLNVTEKSINQQVDIEARIYDVTLNDEFQYGIDWSVVAQYYTMYSGGAVSALGGLGAAGSTLPLVIGSNPIQQANTLSLLFTNIALGNTAHPINSSAAVQALKTQGTVEVLAKPRIRALNNQTALIKVGQELPFFSVTAINSQSQSGNQTISGDIITTITVGTILSITPQISDAGWIAMDVTPVLTSLVAVDTSPDKTATAPVLDTKQASTLVRVQNDMTVVLGGLIQTEKDNSDNKVPLLGDIPFLGKALFAGTYRNKSKSELVIFLTPHIVNGNERSVAGPDVGFEIPTNSVTGSLSRH